MSGLGGGGGGRRTHPNSVQMAFCLEASFRLQVLQRLHLLSLPLELSNSQLGCLQAVISCSLTQLQSLLCLAHSEETTLLYHPTSLSSRFTWRTLNIISCEVNTILDETGTVNPHYQDKIGGNALDNRQVDSHIRHNLPFQPHVQKVCHSTSTSAGNRKSTRVLHQ